ncbi:uncharacterized protein CIMG_08701 [Coccidioides immitis RS]|uniref:Protein kinase domain-containing protein n=4 Tax=Coccidioides immitis TaxID=5501 RepID=A0A0E1RX17_COCIM|nr:uncharacterized protein CIMG_08701 [Coccidioides immitis RS]EAS29955.2 hypothetical protein CIMG_08701 [Coccidioides immitis RS]KMP06941.1 hypothetical protein CIRG_06622 [Coccidioides immitis RMSCC 2394]KMU75172.1 hypothetical protein CISG_04120 [Coccidioides immitis RMSCC 3703]KMU92014.1 hypothetical protein CIHG_09786 [Coccidioides immitis H538.4]
MTRATLRTLNAKRDSSRRSLSPSEKYDKNQFLSIFYPICIGDVLDERYRVKHKLGHGGFTTIWMAHDLQGKRYVNGYLNDRYDAVAGGRGKPTQSWNCALRQSKSLSCAIIRMVMSLLSDPNDSNCLWGMVPLDHLGRKVKYEALAW